jgi:arylsulfatase A-like enzyme
MRNALAAIACCLLTAIPLAAETPNILLILADDLGWADLAVYGSDLHETPHLDRLATQSVRFTNAYAASPVCTPTRASILTGKTPARLQMTIWSEGARGRPPQRKLVHARSNPDLPLAEVTIAEVLHQAGYLTAHIGKWHLGEPGHYPEVQGFDINVGGTYWGAPQTFFFPYRGDRHFGHEPRYVPGLHWGDEGEYLTDQLTDEALTVIDKAGSEPFFLSMWYHSVHTPIEGKPDLVAHYRNKITPEFHHKNAHYAAMVHSLDENVGRLLARLEERGISDETLVIFTSDNGGFVNKYDDETVTDNHPLRSGKGSLYEGGVRVPLMVRWPDHTKAGGVSDELVSTIDFYPTLLEAIGLDGDADHNASVDGVSLLPLLGEPGARLNRDTLYFHYPHYYPTTTPVSSIRSRNWKLLHYYEDSRVELYNLADDPAEQRDLAAENLAQANLLRNRLVKWLAGVEAELPVTAVP